MSGSLDFYGVDGVMDEMKNILRDKLVYTNRVASLPNFIILLDGGDGQTYITEVITDMLVSNKLRDFNGLDEYVEYKPEGALTYIKWMFSDIEDNAIYGNEYKGVVSIDVSRLVNYQNEYQVEYFLTHLKRVAKHATLILFCDTTLGKKGERLISTLRKTLAKVDVISVEKKSSHDYACIIAQNIIDRGIDIQDKESTVKILENTVARDINSVREAIACSEKLAFGADYSVKPPLLTIKATQKFGNNKEVY